MKVKNISGLPLIKRMIFLYLVGPLFLFAIFCSFIVWFVVREMNQELQLSIDSDLNRTVINLNETIETLSMVAEQMAYGYVSVNLSRMVLEDNPYKKSRLIQNISDEINVISFTNTDIRLLGYYDSGQEKFVFLANGSSDSQKLPEDKMLLSRYEFTFRGPHVSIARNYNDLVLSVVKKVPSAEGIYAYVELAVNLKAMNSFLQDAEIVILDESGNLIYSGCEEGKALSGERENRGRIGEYFFTRQEGEGGYQVFMLVPRSGYYQIFGGMLPAAVFLVLGFGSVLSIIVFFTFRNLVRPMHIFEEEICKIQQGNLEITEYQKTNIPEYDHLLDEVMVMKQHISRLLVERETAQRQQAKLKVEQLLYKINPHFLMNSLNTIHWLAMAENTREIDKVAKALNKLLYYNLKVDKDMVSLKEELEAVHQYVLLQQSRFNFEFQTRVKNEKAYEAKVPRFILQPLVENAIYHGLKEDGCLQIIVDADSMLTITVQDNGEGIEQDKLENMKEDVRKGRREKGEFGIGLSYVVQILKEWYGEKASVQIVSKKKEGTSFCISIPFEE